jgi:hypothetical protein
MFKKAEVRGNKKTKKTTTNTKSFISKPRKEREYKPVNVLPSPFYQSQRTGYSWCERCKTEQYNVLKGLTLTCAKGHEINIEKSDDFKNGYNNIINGKVDSSKFFYSGLLMI